MEQKQWYVICYDITEPKRWRKVYKLLHGYGRRLQYSIFRCRLTARGMEKLRWELEQLLTDEDRLLILTICDACENRTASHNRPESWTGGPKPFEIA
ncbi:MAG: CRISPR-associated endonuclease Cas2 [Blastocatellia bacterium]|nr:CRISPR-associated endonuclease Cas2 [Blastocatellia bacterium]